LSLTYIQSPLKANYEAFPILRDRKYPAPVQKAFV